jgi:uncharacterized hydrophobic protein (TIGR00271 family)
MPQSAAETGFHVLATVGSAEQLVPLLTLGCSLARVQGGSVTLLCVTEDGSRPDWLAVPGECATVPIDVEVHAGEDAGKVILEIARKRDPNLLLLGWSGQSGSRRYLLGSTLDPVTRYAPCDVAVVRADHLDQVHRVLVPVGGGPNATLALALALKLAPDIQVTALNIVRPTAGPLGIAAGREQLSNAIDPWRDEGRITPAVVEASNVIEGILHEAADGYDAVLIGASNESYIERQLFGNVPQTVATNAPVPTVIVKRRAGPVKSLLRRAERRLATIQSRLTTSEQVATYREIRLGARPRTDFFVLIGLAATIAALGLLMDSPAVIIGAMVIAPLMSAIFGISLGVVQGDSRLLWQAASTTARGILLAIAIGAGVGLIVAPHEPTAEILARTRPTLLDLFVALASGTAGAYAQCRRDVASALAGVAIAVALVPPLATTGIGIALSSSSIAIGALLLFFTNLSAITATGSVVFLLFGFRPDPGKRLRVFGRGFAGVLVLLILVSIALTALTVDSVRTASQRRTLQAALSTEIGQMDGVMLETWEIEKDDETLRVQVAVKALHPISYSEADDLQQRVSLRLRRPVVLVLSVTQVTRLDPGTQ